MKGYKVFNPDWTCIGFKYEVGKTYELKGKLQICVNGFHFCRNLAKCFRHYSPNPKNKVAEIEALGDIDSKDDKYCTNKIKIVRELSWSEVQRFTNVGDYNTGVCNVGDDNRGGFNVGDANGGGFNTGARNGGNCNTGSYNSGNYNTGDYNMGDRNTGFYNKGSFNSGNWNEGDYNIGDFNICDYSTGCFNSHAQNIMMFNRPSDWTIYDWQDSDAYEVLATLYEEAYERLQKTKPIYKTTIYEDHTLDDELRKKRNEVWGDLSDTDKESIKSLPNFNAYMFEQITGIEVD